MTASNPSQERDLQGEGNYDATKRYDKAASDFAKSGKVEQAARDAAPKTAEEAAEMARAEKAGRSHTKGEDPAVAAPPKTRK
jgi:hypothetical protein